MIYSHRISLSHRQTDGNIGSAEKIRCPAGERLIVASCHRGRRDESIRVLSCLYFVKNDLRHSGRTGITSIAVRRLALVPKDQNIHEIAACGSSSLTSREAGPMRIVIYSHRISLSHRQTDGDMGSAPKISYTQERFRKRRQFLKNGNTPLIEYLSSPSLKKIVCS